MLIGKLWEVFGKKFGENFWYLKLFNSSGKTLTTFKTRFYSIFPINWHQIFGYGTVKSFLDECVRKFLINLNFYAKFLKISTQKCCYQEFSPQKRLSRQSQNPLSEKIHKNSIKPPIFPLINQLVVNLVKILTQAKTPRNWNRSKAPLNNQNT